MENIASIKNTMQGHIGKTVLIKANLGRKRSTMFEAVVSGVYSNVFTVSPIDGVLGSSASLTYSYADVLIKNVQIKSVLAG